MSAGCRSKNLEDVVGNLTLNGFALAYTDNVIQPVVFL